MTVGVVRVYCQHRQVNQPPAQIQARRIQAHQHPDQSIIELSTQHAKVLRLTRSSE